MSIAAQVTVLREFFGGFSAKGLSIRLDPIESLCRYELAETEDDRESLRRIIRGDIVEASTGERVGRIAREVGLSQGRLVIIQDVLRLRPDARRRGFGGALQAAAEQVYQEVGIVEVRADVEGDGSLFLARRGFDFDVADRRRRDPDLTDEQARAQMIYVALTLRGQDYSVDPIAESREWRDGPQTILDRVEEASEEGSQLVAEFRRRAPDGPREPSKHPEAFRTPQDIERFGEGLDVPGLPEGLTLGQAVLSSTRYQALRRLR